MDLRTAENNEGFTALHQNHLTLKFPLYICLNLCRSAFHQKVHEPFSDNVPLTPCLSSNIISSLFGGDKDT